MTNGRFTEGKHSNLMSARLAKVWPAEDSDAMALVGELRQLWMRRQQEVATQWQRTLPLADYIVDRWEKAQLLGFGEGTSVYDNALILGDVTVGEQTWIGPNTVLDGTGGLTIGSHCDISAGVQIYTHDTVRRTVSGGKEPVLYAPTQIGSRCYIGPGTIIAKGVTIGDGCIIGANSLVLHDVPAGSKAFGTPCRVVGSSEPEMGEGENGGMGEWMNGGVEETMSR